MWSPTHINITVHRARNLKSKGKAGTNDCYVSIHLGKDKYHTSIKERSKDPEWNEDCDFPVAEQTSSLKINVYHRNLLGLDEFLGHVGIALHQFQIYERPRSRWFALRGKPGSTKPEKDRGEVELTVSFMVHSLTSSVIDLNKTTEKASKSMSIKNLAHVVGDKLNMKWPSKGSLSIKSGSRSDLSSGAYSAQSMSQKSLTDSCSPTDASKTLESIGKDQTSSLASLAEEMLASEDAPDSVPPSSAFLPSPDNRSSAANLRNDGNGNVGDASPIDGCVRTDGSEKEVKTPSGKTRITLTPESLLTKTTSSSEKLSEKMKRFKEGGSAVKSYTLSYPGRSVPQVSAYEMHEMEEYKKTRRELEKNRNVVSREAVECFSGFEREDLIKLIIDQGAEMRQKDAYVHDLEDYIDDLLVKVIETQPKLLQKPYERGTKNQNQNNNNNNNKSSSSSSSSQAMIPPSASMAPGIYVATTTGESPCSRTVAVVTAPPPSSSKKTTTSAAKNVKRQFIASPFKKLQALIK